MATPSVNQVVVVGEPPVEVLGRLLRVSGADRYQPVAQSVTGLTLHRKRTPLWAVVIAILAFPFGLVALLAKNEETVTVQLVPVAGGTQVTIAGQASSVLQSALQYALAGGQPSAAGLPAQPAPAATAQPAPVAPVPATAPAASPTAPSPAEPTAGDEEAGSGVVPPPPAVPPPRPAPPMDVPPLPSGFPGGSPFPPAAPPGGPAPPPAAPPGGAPPPTWEPPVPPAPEPPGGEPD